MHGIHDHIGEQSVGAGHPGIAGQTSFAEVLQGQGYQTGLVGKWHLNHFRQPPPGWEVRAGLSFDVLKNADAALGRVLARAAQRENHVLYAAIFSIYECGTVDESGDFPGWDEPEDFNWDERRLGRRDRSIPPASCSDWSLRMARGPTMAHCRCWRGNCYRLGRWMAWNRTTRTPR